MTNERLINILKIMKKKYEPKVGDIVSPIESFSSDIYKISKIENGTVFLKEITNLDIYTRDSVGYYRFSDKIFINSFKKIK